MTQDVAIVREDTLAVLVLEGAMSLGYTRPGRVTSYPVPDRTHISDGVVLLPDQVTVRALVSPSPGRADLTSGPDRLREVEQYLDECRAQAVPVSVLRPRGGLIRSLVLEEYSTSEDNTDSLAVDCRFVAVQLATTRAAQVAAIRGKPVDAARSAVDSEEKDTGPGSTKDAPQSLLSATVDTIRDAFGGGS